MIEITQGDTKSITVKLKSGITEIPFVEGDSVKFGAKKKNGDTLLISKETTTFTDGQAIINLSTTDTNLPRGTYLYDIQYDKANGERYTIISSTILIKQGITE